MNTTQFTWKGHGTNVSLAGTFSKWQGISGSKIKDTWVWDLPLKKGEYEYKYIVDGNWCIDVEKPFIMKGVYTNNVVNVLYPYDAIMDALNEPMSDRELKDVVIAVMRRAMRRANTPQRVTFEEAWGNIPVSDEECDEEGER